MPRDENWTHERQCKGISRRRKREGEANPRCRQFARTGTDYCKKHGGRGRKGHSVKNHYSKFVGESLKKQLEKLAKTDADRRHSLASEVDVARVVAGEAVQIFDVAHTKEGVKPAQKALASTLCRDALTHVSQIVERSAKTRALSQATVDLELLDYMLNQVVRILDRVLLPLSNGKELVQLLNAELQDIKLPQHQHAGDKAREVMDELQAMDRSVPKLLEEAG